MRIVIRVDDFGWSPLSGHKQDPGLRLAQRFHAAMQGLPYLGAVIPEAVDPDGLAWLQSRPDGLTVAMHGFDHAKSEYWGLTAEECRQRLEMGKAKLPGIPLQDFVLPFNTWEPNLKDACFSAGLRRVWGGQHHLRFDPSIWPSPPPPYPLGRLTFIPSWKPFYGSILWPSGTHERSLCESLPRIMNRDGRAVLVLHLTWEAARGDEFRGVRWLIERYWSDIISPDDYVEMFT